MHADTTRNVNEGLKEMQRWTLVVSDTHIQYITHSTEGIELYEI